MALLMLLLFGLPTFALLPDTISLQSSLPDTCGTKITQLEDQIENATLPKIVHFIESNTTAFKSLSQMYGLYWLDTVYNWNVNATTCSAQLNGTTTDFQLSTLTNPFIGVVHITVNPSLTKVAGLKIDIPDTEIPHPT
jgi:hypothetical protein